MKLGCRKAGNRHLLLTLHSRPATGEVAYRCRL